MFVAAGGNPGLRNNKGKSALHLAALNASAGMINALLGGPLPAENRYPSKPGSVVRAGSSSAAALLLSSSSSRTADVPNSAGETPLHYAARHKHRSPAVIALLDKGAGPEVPNGTGRMAASMLLETAAYESGTATALAALVGRLEPRDTEAMLREAGWSPLHLAALQGDRDLASALLPGGGGGGEAVAAAEDRRGRTPLHIAAWAGSDLITSLLLAHGGANVGALDTGRSTPLMVAVSLGRSSTVRLLAAAAQVLPGGLSSLKAKDAAGCTPLMMAIERHDQLSVRALLEAGANPDEVATIPGSRNKIARPLTQVLPCPVSA